jgi:hypothetical protein
MYLVHFKSKEQSELSLFARFWNVFPSNPDFVVDQDDEDINTSHWSFDDLNTDVAKIDPAPPKKKSTRFLVALGNHTDPRLTRSWSRAHGGREVHKLHGQDSASR